MVYFKSTAIRGAEYDAPKQVLFLQFTSSLTLYDYPDVPESLYAGLLAAESKGTFFNRYIRDQYSVNR